MSGPRSLVAAAVALVLAGACAGGSSAPPTTLPGDLVPSVASSAAVTVTAGGAGPVSVPASEVAKAFPMLVRRVFDAREPLASYGLDPPRAVVTFTLTGGTTVVLRVGDEEFDSSARYVRRDGDERIWIVLDESLDPILAAAGISPSSGS
jgi:hypothetical protein